jgi:hypothetical protein
LEKTILRKNFQKTSLGQAMGRFFDENEEGPQVTLVQLKGHLMEQEHCSKS